MFSFNSPYGACPECGGLGTQMEFNLALIVPDRSLTLDEGALAPLGNLRGDWGRSQLAALGEAYGFDLDTPFGSLSNKAQQAMLHGTEEEITIKLDLERMKGEYRSAYEGLVPWLRRRYRQTNSDAVRQWIESYMSIGGVLGLRRGEAQARGARREGEGREHRRGVRVERQGGLAVLLHARSRGERRRDRRADPQGRSSQRLHFLENVGLGYLTLDRSAVDARRAARRSGCGSPLRSGRSSWESSTSSTSRASVSTTGTTSA